MAAINAKSAEQTKLETVPPTLLTPPELRGRVRIHLSTYTWLAGFVDSGSTITGAALPVGAKIVGGFLVSQAGVAASTIQVSINAVNISGALAIGAATARHELPDKDNWHNAIGVDFGGYAPVMTTGGAAMVAGNKVALVLLYVVD